MRERIEGESRKETERDRLCLALMSSWCHISSFSLSLCLSLSALINFASPFKKPIASFTSDSHRPLTHIKGAIYSDPFPLKLFFKVKILCGAPPESKARHSGEMATYIKAVREQQGHQKEHFAWTTLNVVHIFLFTDLNIVISCRVTLAPVFNCSWHVFHH